MPETLLALLITNI